MLKTLSHRFDPIEMKPSSSSLNAFKPILNSNQTQKVDSLCFPINLISPPNFTTSISSINNSKLIHLHKLSGLRVPRENSKEFNVIKNNLNQMLGILDSIHDFEKSKKFEKRSLFNLNFNHLNQPYQINWNTLIDSQKSFLNFKSNSIPGLNSIHHDHHHQEESEKESEEEFKSIDHSNRLNELNQLKEMSEKHLIKRKGLGNSPNKESLYYFIKKNR
ncbi:hypothetical protein DFH28DRAFT_1196572 [Melampsora americana]|nr:hypothetical protein DFH28DRAFT_1196572 [Melampsora americana]